MSEARAPEFGKATIDNCADEPIHIPGSIQPHGALLAFESGRLLAWSENAAAMLACEPAPGKAIYALGLPAGALRVSQQLLDDSAASSGVPSADRAEIGGLEFDVVAHLHLGRSLLEFELPAEKDAPAGPRGLSSRVFDRIKRASDLQQLLDLVVREIRAWTGFDRVMAYRFRHDASGDVVAEAKAEGLEAFLGLRYPASDIPAQARRLYTLNTLRLIPDIGYAPVPLVGLGADAPLDLTHSILRSVSPIHVEYLQNMGVGASMSVSLVVNDQLWGLIACHHYSPKRAPYGVRTACDVLAQLVASSIQVIETRELASRQEAGAATLAVLASGLARADETLEVLSRHVQPLLQLFEADAIVLTQQSKLFRVGDLGIEEAREIAAHADCEAGSVRAIDAVDEWPEAMRGRTRDWAGALCIHYDKATTARLIALRREQVRTVRWAGTPEKLVKTGPSGPRLTPRGSFSEWQETVRGRSVPWSDLTLQFAQQILHELQRASMARHAEMEAARRNLIAMLGHDLRDPLQAIRMVSGMLQRQGGAGPLGTRLDSSSGRMQRLISQVLDFSRAEAGLPLAASKAPTELAALVDELVAELQAGHPGVDIRVTAQKPAIVEGDATRLEQAISNLLSNSRHHGELGEPVLVDLVLRDGRAFLSVKNVAKPIPEAVLAELFAPYKRSGGDPVRNRTGLGLGLYIASRIATEHQGSLDYRHEAPHVVFELSLPLMRTAG